MILIHSQSYNIMLPATQADRRSYDRNGFQQEQRESKLMSYLADSQREQQRLKNWQMVLPNLQEMRNSGKEGEKQVIRLVREGVFDDFRKVIWPRLAQQPLFKFEDCKNKCENKEVNLDLDRTFPNHKEAKMIEERLKVVLNALAIALPEVGYCQGMNFIVGTLLLRLEEEQAFKVAYHIFHWQRQEQLLKDLSLIHEQLHALDKLIKAHYPKLFKLLQKHEIQTILFASSWFITLYCNSLPACFAFRIIESFLLEGEKILYRVALQILKWKKKLLKSMNEVEKIIDELKNYDEFNEGNVDTFFREMYEIPLKRDEIKQYKEEYRNKSPKKSPNKQ